jgi:hypothetical protein
LFLQSVRSERHGHCRNAAQRAHQNPRAILLLFLNIHSPVHAQVPLWFPEGPSDFTLIGLGDIVLPGLLVAFALRVDHITLNTPSLFGGYFFYSMYDLIASCVHPSS